MAQPEYIGCDLDWVYLGNTPVPDRYKPKYGFRLPVGEIWVSEDRIVKMPSGQVILKTLCPEGVAKGALIGWNYTAND